jgi:hypothetical protein
MGMVGVMGKGRGGRGWSRGEGRGEREWEGDSEGEGEGEGEGLVSPHSTGSSIAAAEGVAFLAVVIVETQLAKSLIL